MLVLGRPRVSTPGLFIAVLSWFFGSKKICIVNYSTISAILRGRWLIDKSYAESQLPFVLGILKRNDVSFSYKGASEKDDSEADRKDYGKHIATVAGRGVYKVGYYTDLSKIPDDSVAFVDIVGPIMKYGGMCSYGSVDKVNILRKIDGASNISGVILNVDSPGGQVDGTTMLADQIKAMGKPTIAMVDDGLMASAAMWIGSAADEIYATKASDSFGSIGVYATLFDWNAYFRSEGIPVHEIYAPQSVEKNKDYRDAISGDYQAMKDDLAYTADNFIRTIETNRPKAAKSKDKWSKGGMFYASEATTMGLIDGIKSFDEIIGRIGSLAKKTFKSKNREMSATAFQNTLSAAQAESFEVVEGGFLLTEENLNSIEARISDLGAQAETARNESEQAAQSLTQVQSQLQELQGQHQELTAERDNLQAEVARLNALTPTPAATQKPEDQFGDDPNAKYLTSVDAEAARIRAMRNN